MICTNYTAGTIPPPTPTPITAPVTNISAKLSYVSADKLSEFVDVNITFGGGSGTQPDCSLLMDGKVVNTQARPPGVGAQNIVTVSVPRDGATHTFCAT